MSKRSKNIEGKLGAFLKQYARKAQPGQEPNDRQYDRKVEEKIKQMSPEQLSELMTGEGEVDLELEEKWLISVPIEGVQYLPNASVKVVKGPHQGHVGVIRSLVNLRVRSQNISSSSVEAKPLWSLSHKQWAYNHAFRGCSIDQF